MNKVYNKNGIRILEAFDNNAETLLCAFNNYADEYPFIEVHPDESTGVDSGLLLTSVRGNHYKLRTMVDFYGDAYSLQSFCYNYDDGNYYRFDASTTVIVYDSSFNQVKTVTTPSSLGHTNDACYHKGLFYFPNLDYSTIVVWNPSENTVSSLQISGIVQPTNGSERDCDAICEIGRDIDDIYLICRDKRSSELVHEDGDMMSVYRYSLLTNQATLLFENPWDCVYVQGAACYNGIIYVACNTQTSGSASNYTGITVKVIRTDIWSLIDEMTCSGVFEPEGMDIVPNNGSWELEMGIGHWPSTRMILRFTAPYSLLH